MKLRSKFNIRFCLSQTEVKRETDLNFTYKTNARAQERDDISFFSIPVLPLLNIRFQLEDHYFIFSPRCHRLKDKHY